MTKKKPKIHIGDVKGDITISQNQSGGITAHEVGTDGIKKNSKSIIKVITIVASIVAILTYFGIKPSKENKMPKNEEDKISIGDINGDVVISQNQSGGITAGKFYSVNIGTDNSRHLDEQSSKKLISLIPNENEVVISYPNGDGEAYQFALEIKEKLESEGFTVFGLNTVYYNKMFYGQSVHPHEKNNKVTVIEIGAKPKI